MRILTRILLVVVLAASAFGQLTLDKTFTAGVTDGQALGYVSAAQPDGKIIVGGSFQFARGVPRGSIARLNSDGSIDTSFNSGVTGFTARVYDIKVLADGKILIAGTFTTYNGSPAGRIARLNTDGSMDTSFNPGGVGATGPIHSISFQSDGKIILSGQITSYNGVPKFTVIRINADGSLDESFTSPFTTSSPFVEQTALQPTGKIVIAGSFSTSGYGDVARLNPDGSVDTSFTPITTNGEVYGLAFDANGKIMICGLFDQINGSPVISIARLTPDGAIDPTFTSPFEDSFTLEYLAIKPDGKIVVAGTFESPSNSLLVEFAVRQLNPDGMFDPSFVAPKADGGGYHLLLLPDGKLLLTGTFVDIHEPRTGHQGIVRLNSDGSVDSSFNSWISTGGGVGELFRQVDDKFLAAGDFYRSNGSPHRSLARFNPDGTVDESFDSGWGFYESFSPIFTAQSPSQWYLSFTQETDGKLVFYAPWQIVITYNEAYGLAGLRRINQNGSPDGSFSVPASASDIYDVLALPDGKKLIAGRAMGVIGPAPLRYRILMRLNADGTLDPSFTAGTTSVANGFVRKILRQQDGRLIAIGSFSNYLGANRNSAVRVNEDGTIDNSFTANGGNWRSLALQSDGKVLITGSSFIDRWNSNGTDDPTFNPGTGPNGVVMAMVVQSDDKIIIGGTFTTYNGQPANRLARLNADGTLDTTVVSGLDSDPANIVSSIIPTADGHILIGGVFSNYGGIPRNNIAKLRIDDPTGTIFDYDGDGRTDFSVFRPSTGAWYLQRSTAGFQGLQFGADGDKLTPADYDGDGKTDIAVYRPAAGQWFVLKSSTGTVDYPVFGAAEDLPAPGDFDGDGKADLVVFRPSQGIWYRVNSSNGSFFAFPFGTNGDVPTVGDFDGDGKNDYGIFRPSIGDWYNVKSSDGSLFGERFGQAGDRIAPADYDGDGKTDIAIFRPSTGLWVVRNSATATYSYYVFGSPTDVPISGDYDGDGKADIGVWRPSDGTWYIQRSDRGQFIVFPWGQNGDTPTPSAYGN